jgi:hypothetical protein
LGSVEFLDCSDCPALTGSGLVHLRAIKDLRIGRCSASMRRQARKLGLPFSA